MQLQAAPGTRVIEVHDMTNAEFIDAYAAPGRVGLAGGWTLIDRAIRRAQRHLNEDLEYSLWSHAFLFSGRRIDGQHWVLESDLEIHRRKVRLGVQENRAVKFSEDAGYQNLAILDFQLDDDGVRAVLTEGLDLMSGNSHYSLRELVGTLLAMVQPTLRGRENLLAREGALYCSAMVQACYARAGISFVDGVAMKNTTPRDIAATSVPHTAWVLARQRGRGETGNT